MKQLSKRATTALEALKAGGGFWTGVMPSYSFIGFVGVEVRTVLMGPENGRIKGVGAAALGGDDRRKGVGEVLHDLHLATGTHRVEE